MPSTIAAFIQPLPGRGRRGGRGGVIRGGGYPGINGGGGGGVWLGVDDTSFSINARIISQQAGASKRDSPWLLALVCRMSSRLVASDLSLHELRSHRGCLGH